MYVVLTGAKKNIGDFLITDRSKKLLNKFKPNEKLIQYPSWERLDEHLETVNSSKALIIMGGPGFQPKFYPGVYKLTDDLSKIKVPIIPLGLGWKGFPGDRQTVKKYSFTKSSKKALLYISKNTKNMSCRDYITKQILNDNGVYNVIMTGCPVWYDLESIGKKLHKPKIVKKIAFTPAQQHIYRNQCILIMRDIKKRFPDAEIYCSFHRGIGADDRYTKKRDELNNIKIKNEAEKLNFNVVDAAFDLSRLDFYDDCDIHVGYRLHAHLYFLSKRKPSFLINEDGRGVGASSALDLKGFNAFERNFLGHIDSLISLPVFPRAFKAVFPIVKPSDLVVEQLINFINEEIENNYERFNRVPSVIDNHFQVMKKFIMSMP